MVRHTEPGSVGTAQRVETWAGDSSPMPDDRRASVPGGTVSLAVVTHRAPRRYSKGRTWPGCGGRPGEWMRQAPFRIPAAVVLPDHAHSLRSLPRGDVDDPRRVGRIKVRFTRSIPGRGVARPR